jgi:hypothetical protein
MRLGRWQLKLGFPDEWSDVGFAERVQLLRDHEALHFIGVSERVAVVDLPLNIAQWPLAEGLRMPHRHSFDGTR